MNASKVYYAPESPDEHHGCACCCFVGVFDCRCPPRSPKHLIPKKELLQNLDTLHEGRLLLMHWAIFVPESLVPESLRISWHDLYKTFIWCLPVQLCNWSGRLLCIWNLRRSTVIRAISIPTDNYPQLQEIQTIDQVWHHLISSHDLFPIFGISRLCRNSGEAFFDQGHFWVRGVSSWCEH